MMSWQNNMVIAYGIRQEIGHLAFVGELDNLLGATKIRFGLIAHQRSLCNEIAREIASQLEDSNRPFFHITPDAYANTRLEVGVELIVFYHIERDGAMSKKHLARIRIDRCRIGLKARNTQQRTDHHHRQHCRYISLTASHIAF